VTAGETLDPDRVVRRVRSAALEISGAEADLAGAAWSAAVRDARLALASQLIAGSKFMLEHARRHALDRVQFGRPIATFQAVRHKLAETLVAIESAAAVADAAVEAGETCDPLLAAVAKSLAGRAARLAATNAQQVLAGIGFTTEHPFQRSMKRTMVLDPLFGSARSLPVEIGRELVARRSAPRLVEL
jgi:alkylation response protein AidB-like acyl-CoA dehydrogenase